VAQQAPTVFIDSPSVYLN